MDATTSDIKIELIQWLSPGNPNTTCFKRDSHLRGKDVIKEEVV